jgi:hypothetical protein
MSDRIGGLEADAANFAGEAVGIAAADDVQIEGQPVRSATAGLRRVERQGQGHEVWVDQPGARLAGDCAP